jgi:hypothetical protein
LAAEIRSVPIVAGVEGDDRDRRDDTAQDQIRCCNNRGEKNWRDFLLDKREHPGDHPQYIFPLDSLAKTSDTTAPVNFASYIHRVAAAGIWHDPGREALFSFSMLCSISVIGVIALRNAHGWGERLHVRSGLLKVTSRTPPPEVIGMIKAQANDHLNMSRQLSERQKTLDNEAFSKDEEKALQSGYLQIMALDVARATKGDPQELAKLSRTVLRATRNQKTIKQLPDWFLHR